MIVTGGDRLFSRHVRPANLSLQSAKSQISWRTHLQRMVHPEQSSHEHPTNLSSYGGDEYGDAQCSTFQRIRLWKLRPAWERSSAMFYRRTRDLPTKRGRGCPRCPKTMRHAASNNSETRGMAPSWSHAYTFLYHVSQQSLTRHEFNARQGPTHYLQEACKTARSDVCYHQ